MSTVSKKNISLVLTAIVAVVLIIFGVFSYHRVQKTDPLKDAKLGFQYLYPTRLPSGIRIVSSRIAVKHAAGGGYGSVAAEMTFRDSEWVYGIQEARANGEDVAVKSNDYSPASVLPTCVQKTSGEQSFRLCHWIDYRKISVFEVKFIKSGVYVVARLPSTINKPISEAELMAFVQSFNPADASGLPVLADAI